MLTVIEIGEKIAVARKVNNLSQAQLAETLAISAQAVGKWERGESMPDIIMFGRLAEVLGVDLNYFGSGEPLAISPSVQSIEVKNEATHKPGWNMSGSIWTDVDFSGLRGLAERFSGSNIEKCLFIESELSGLSLRGNNIKESDFTRSDLSTCRFSGTNFERDIFNGCNFTKSEFIRSTIKNSDFSEADLTNTLFKWSHIQKSKLSNSILNGTAFQYGQLTDITFDGDINNCDFENCDFVRVEFNGVIIRETFFKNCKLKRAKFIACKTDKLSYAFMKSCKADLSGVEIIEDA